MTVLIVDDVPDNVDLLRTMLNKSGFTHIITAASGREAVQHLRDNMRDERSTVDAVLLDIMMLEMDGYEVCRTLCRHDVWADIPVIMVTANATWQEKVSRVCFAAGVFVVLFFFFRCVVLLLRFFFVL